MKMLKYISIYRWHIAITVVFAVGVYYYFNIYTANNSAEAATFYVVETVSRGEVTSGIQTTGNIIAAQKLDIDVYKQLSRIEAVNVQNGVHVEAGEVLVSFDKSDAYVSAQSARVTLLSAELALENEKANVGNPSTQIRTVENQILGYKKIIDDSKQSLVDAYIDFLNENLEIKPNSNQNDRLSNSTQPSISGRYVSDIQGEYRVQVYASGAPSGYSYSVSGLESVTESVVFGTAIDLGTRGLKITFSIGMKDTIRARDAWIIFIPNDGVATYEESKRTYEQRIANIEKTIRDAEVNLANAQQELENLQRTDSIAYRNLDIEKAEASLAEARQRLSKNYDVVQERDIVAPFSGTVEGMENVVVGATPTGGASDSVNLGTLISDEFLTTFTLSATDVAKVVVGQKVKVTVTSFVERPIFEAKITQVSSLPTSSGVAQYKVEALLDYDRNSADIVLREGMLADIEVVQNVNPDAIRVPTAAISYEQGTPKVVVIDKLTADQQQQIERMGIVRTGEDTLATYSVEVTLGVIGKYYVEITNGLSEGDVILASSLTETASAPVVQQAGFGGGVPGGARPGGPGGQGNQTGGVNQSNN
ncbi:MAG: hypothetical protein ACK42D_02620 [Candidatus Paceibacteria bacterium]